MTDTDNNKSEGRWRNVFECIILIGITVLVVWVLRDALPKSGDTKMQMFKSSVAGVAFTAGVLLVVRRVKHALDQ